MLRSALVWGRFAPFCMNLESFCCVLHLMWGRFAAFCLNLGSFCCVLHRFGVPGRLFATLRHLLACWRRLRCDMAGVGFGPRSSITADAAFLRRAAPSTVTERAPRGAAPGAPCPAPPAMSHLSLRQQASKWRKVAKSLPGTPNRCRTQQNDTKLMHNAAKRRQINAECSKPAPN